MHTTSNHNGQYSGQHGIHGFWESRIPEIYAESQWDLLADKAIYVKDPLEFTWRTISESALASDSVLQIEKQLNERFSPGRKYAYENRNGVILKQYSTDYCDTYQQALNGMVERRMKESVFAVASFWYTAWINAGRPDVKNLINKALSEEDQRTFGELDNQWKKEKIKGRSCS